MLYRPTAFHIYRKKWQLPACSSIIVLLLLYFYAGPAFGFRAEEYRIKSAYLEKITRFIQWPEPAAAKDEKLFFVIGIAGENPFNGILQEDYMERQIKGKPVRVIKISGIEGIKSCDLLFISGSEEDRLEEYIRMAEQFNVLTVGDTAGFAQKGVHINFYIKKQKVLFKINPEAMKRAALSAGSLLLDYATVVKPNH